MNLAGLIKQVDGLISALEAVDQTIVHYVLVDDEEAPAAGPGEWQMIHHIVRPADADVPRVDVEDGEHRVAGDGAVPGSDDHGRDDVQHDGGRAPRLPAAANDEHVEEETQ